MEESKTEDIGDTAREIIELMERGFNPDCEMRRSELFRRAAMRFSLTFFPQRGELISPPGLGAIGARLRQLASASELEFDKGSLEMIEMIRETLVRVGALSRSSLTLGQDLCSA